MKSVPCLCSRLVFTPDCAACHSLGVSTPFFVLVMLVRDWPCFFQVLGDGREFVVSDPDTVKIRAEDGRRVDVVDVSPYLSKLPSKIDTSKFSTLDASGSTSQAANIQVRNQY